MKHMKSSMRFSEHLPLQNVSKKNKSTIIFKDGKQLNFKKKKVSIWQEFQFILFLDGSVFSPSFKDTWQL